MKKDHELALQWLKKADNDLITARQTLLLEDAPTDTICFHAQQAIEKSLKGLLTFYSVSFPKIHELLRLLDLALTYLPELENFRTDFAEITNYSVEVRYPDVWLEPSREDAEHALKIAEQIVTNVRKKMQQN